MIYIPNYASHIFEHLKFLRIPKFISAWFPLSLYLIQVCSVFWSHTGHCVNHNSMDISHRLLITILEMCLSYFWWSTETCGGNTPSTAQSFIVFVYPPCFFPNTSPAVCHPKKCSPLSPGGIFTWVSSPTGSPVLVLSLKTPVISTVLHLLILMLMFFCFSFFKKQSYRVRLPGFKSQSWAVCLEQII